MTQGRATSSMEFSHYAEVPQPASPSELVQKSQGLSQHQSHEQQDVAEDTRMAKKKFERTKPHVNIGTIGHIDHGKTT